VPQVASPRAIRTVLPIKDRVDRAVQLVLRARILFDIWFYFEAKETRSPILDIMQAYSEYFRFMPHAHQLAFIITFAVLFDRSRNTISLHHLVREMTRNKQLSQQAQAEVNELLDKVKPLEAKIVVLRHKAFAHRSAHTSYDDVFRKAKVSATQMRELTETALLIANKLAEAVGVNIGFFNELPREDAARMMRTLMKIEP
jgi:AbiU2